MRFDPEQVRGIESLILDAEWQASNPLWGELRLSVLHGGVEVASTIGPSPLTLTVSPFEVGDVVHVSLKPDQDGQRDGVVYDQPIRLAWDLAYRGSEKLTVENAGC